jgi:hypothetical protein
MRFTVIAVLKSLTSHDFQQFIKELLLFVCISEFPIIHAGVQRVAGAAVLLALLSIRRLVILGSSLVFLTIQHVV